ncbi:hypothetical protein A0H81_12067 [Grifola frondosa]|uniref:Uncharacterized protein n=1 Tax=Grifola frondosa TaxID=5627 RepID=A0A1C7LV02_GRIFR|nr:hypothetical protein A0H81_12067 [Grifola frondosa]
MRTLGVRSYDRISLFEISLCARPFDQPHYILSLCVHPFHPTLPLKDVKPHLRFLTADRCESTHEKMISALGLVKSMPNDVLTSMTREGNVQGQRSNGCSIHKLGQMSRTS